MQRKKSGFWLFIWSLVPGAGEMYLGFMKMGISLMLGFMGLCVVVSITGIGALAVFPITMWFYSFFHVHNLAAMEEQAFWAVEDQMLFGLGEWETLGELGNRLSAHKRKWLAVGLILIGACTLWKEAFAILCEMFGWDNRILSQIYYFMRDDIPRIVFGFVIICVGMWLIRGRKEELDAGSAGLLEDKTDTGNGQDRAG